ncbi:MAG: hypothetical protein KC609_26585 [Myxococcales bacterium]|nr:hypothetical protein [Myxococcales bacterium]
MGRVRYLNIAVSCYSGYQLNEKPLAFAIGGRRFRVARIIRRWRSPSGRSWFEVETDDARRFYLAYDAVRDIWIGEAERDETRLDPASDEPSTET